MEVAAEFLQREPRNSRGANVNISEVDSIRVLQRDEA